MNMSSQRFAGLVLGSLVTLSTAVTPAASQVLAPTDPSWARWLGLETSTQFVLGRGRGQLQIGDFQEPQRVRVCVTEGTTPASLNIGARVLADDSQIVVPASSCGEVVGSRITVEPAGALGGDRRVKGVYSFVG
jgi:hypothetical protein